MKCLKTLEIDTEKRIYRVNGTDISSVHFFSLEFRDGYWSLKIAENDHFSEYHNKLVELMDADVLAQMSKDCKENDVPNKPEQL